MDLYKDFLGNVGFLQVIKRGTAEILEEDDSGIFVYDTRSEAFMLKTDDVATGIEWLKKHEDKNYELMMIYNEELVEFAMERYGFKEEEKCYQGVWTKPEPPALKGLLDFRAATMDDVPFIKEYYEDWYGPHGEAIIAAGELFIALLPASETKVGFIGMHPEGATGLLFVLPEYRNRGYAEEMEAYMSAFTLGRGLFSYGHVKIDNEKSMNLQNKVGVEFWDGTMSFVFK